MKYRIFLPLGVLAGILAFCLWNAGTMEAHSLRWQAQLENAEALARAGNWPAALDALAESRQDWTWRQTYLHIVTGHGTVDDAESLYRRCLVIAAAREDTEFFTELSSLREQLRLLAEMERLSLRNIL